MGLMMIKREYRIKKFSFKLGRLVCECECVCDRTYNKWMIVQKRVTLCLCD